MDGSEADRKRRRQDPVSCRLCRVKKLKCNRLNPCSNCIARKTTCEFEQNQTTTATRIQHDAEPSNSAILSRLQRLEEMITRMNQHVPNTPDSLTTSRNPEPDLPSSILTPTEQSHQIESQDLQSIGTQQPSLFPGMSYAFVFDTVPLDFITKHDWSSLDSQPTLNRQRRILLPTYNDARMLFDRYAKYICHFHNIIHLPTLRQVLENVYLQQAQRASPDTDHVALLLSIFSTVLCYSKWSEPDSVPLETADDREQVFLIWFRSTLDLLDHSRRVLPASLEIVQTTIIVVFLDYNTEGFTSRARAMLGQGLYSAKELGLHRLDCPSAIRRREATMKIESMIDLEMKRRIFWHLCATEWMVSLAGSPQEGTYNAHPNQMRVRLPRNIDDEVLDRGNMTEDLPLTQPTPMSYGLQRIRLAEISRTVVDTLHFGLSDQGEHDYTQVMSLDKRVQNFIEDLPVFLKLDKESLRRSQYILERYPYFAMQRYIINIGAHSIRCKLHQPYLIRGEAKPKHERSVDICLSSAMTVISINKAIRDDPTNYIPERVKLIGLLHHMFLATVVLVMDLCFNRTIDVNDPRNLEVISALGMLEDAKDHSISVQRFLDSLLEKLNKHHVRLLDQPAQRTTFDATNSTTDKVAHKWQPTDIPLPYTIQAAVVGDASQTATLGFDDWRNATHGEMATMPDWDQLFSELDAFIA